MLVCVHDVVEIVGLPRPLPLQVLLLALHLLDDRPVLLGQTVLVVLLALAVQLLITLLKQSGHLLSWGQLLRLRGFGLGLLGDDFGRCRLIEHFVFSLGDLSGAIEDGESLLDSLAFASGNGLTQKPVQQLLICDLIN